jgi:hypothetical protein
MSDTYLPTLQEEVNRKAYGAIAELAVCVDTGVLAPVQADRVLQILQTAFNGVVTDGDFCETITEFAYNLRNFIPLKPSLKIALKKEPYSSVFIEINGCGLSVDNVVRTFDTPAESYNAAQKVINKLMSAGYRPVKDKA